jgi:lysophospholipase L1-like esterase
VFGRRALLIALSLFVSLAISEAVLRVFWTNPYRSEVPETVVRLRMQHALRSLPVDRSAVYPDRPIAQLRTDERGYILPSHQFERPQKTIVFLGGSTTECAAVTEDQRFPALVSKLLEERGGLRVNTLNGGLSGNTTHDELNLLLNHVIADKPDIAVLMEAANDIGVMWQEHSYRSRMDEPLSRKLAFRWALQAASSRLSLFGALRSYVTLAALKTSKAEGGAFPEREKVTVPSAEFEQRLRAFARLTRAFGIEPVLMTQPAVGIRTALTPDWIDTGNQATFNEVVRKVALDEQVVLVDLERRVQATQGWDQPMNLFYDGVHVTDAGSQLYADEIAKRLLATLLQRANAAE